MQLARYWILQHLALTPLRKQQADSPLAPCGHKALRCPLSAAAHPPKVHKAAADPNTKPDKFCPWPLVPCFLDPECTSAA